MCNGTGSVNNAVSTTTNTSTTGNFLAGCSSFNGFSSLTGESCMTPMFALNSGTPPIYYPISSMSNIPLCEIQRSLRMGSTGEDVRCLQRFLNYAGYTVAIAGAGSMGNETMYFGPATASAVTRWQNANAPQVLVPAGLSSGTGLFGPSSFSHYVTIVINSLRSSM